MSTLCEDFSKLAFALFWFEFISLKIVIASLLKLTAAFDVGGVGAGVGMKLPVFWRVPFLSFPFCPVGAVDFGCSFMLGSLTIASAIFPVEVELHVH